MNDSPAVEVHTMDIFTRYQPATDTQGARICARFADPSGPRLTLGYVHALTHEGNHIAAAKALLAGALAEGYMVAPPNGWVCVATASDERVHACARYLTRYDMFGVMP